MPGKSHKLTFCYDEVVLYVIVLDMDPCRPEAVA